VYTSGTCTLRESVSEKFKSPHNCRQNVSLLQHKNYQKNKQ